MELGMDAGKVEERPQGITVAQVISECKAVVRGDITIHYKTMSFHLK